MTRAPLAVAHRGFSARHPENTLAGAEAAIRAGADLVEADLRLSRDGTAFCFHDADLMRLAGRPARVDESDDQTLRWLSRLDGGQTACLAQMIATVSGRAGLLVDVKLDEMAMLDALAPELEAAAWPSGIWLGLRSAGLIASARTRFGSRVSLLAFMPGIDTADACLAAGADALRLWEEELALEAAQALRAHAPIWVTAGRCNGHAVGDTDAAGLSRIRGFGAAAVLLNDPTLLTREAG